MARRKRVTFGGSGKKVSFLVKVRPILELTDDELRILATTLLQRAMINVFWKQDNPKVEKTVDEVSQKVARFIADNKIGDSRQPVVFRVRVLGRGGGAR